MNLSPRPLIFVHLPKTAGSTLQELIAGQYAGGRSFIFTGDPAQHAAFLALPQEERDAFDVLLGHVQYGLHLSLSSPATYMTMLRDPVDRVVSHYHFILARPDHYLHETLRASGYSLREWVLQAPIVIDNYQLRWLISRPLGEVPPGGVTPAMLDEARANLHSAFSVVGIMEQFDRSLACLCRAFDWSGFKADARRNVNPDRPDLADVDDDTLDAIRQVNRFDIELYNSACELFEAQCRRLGIPPCLESSSLYAAPAAAAEPARKEVS